MELTEQEIIEAISQKPLPVTLSCGSYVITPLTMRRLSALAVILKDVQGDPTKFKDPSNPEFHKAVADALVNLGDKMPEALSCVTGDTKFGELKDITIMDALLVSIACAKVNRLSFLRSGFRQAMEVISGSADQKSRTPFHSPYAQSQADSRNTRLRNCWIKLRRGLTGLWFKH